MTDIDILNTSWKTEVTPEQSAEIQRLFFKHGKSFHDGKTDIETKNHIFLMFYRYGMYHIENTLSFVGEDLFNKSQIYYMRADDIIAALRKLEEGDKPVSEETNEDGWIRLSKQFPPLEEIVELEINKDDKISKIKGYFRLSVSVSGFESYIFVDQKHYEFSGTVVQWRPLKEKRPDFGKLRGGDKIFITYDERDEIYGVTFKYMTDGYLRSKYHPNHDYIDFCKDRIKKITRINLETREFEEI